MAIRFPARLQPGDRIGVTAPSSGVEAALRPRLQVAVDHVRAAGFDVVIGTCMDGEAVVSAPAADRAAELQAMLTGPTIRAVIPPWGGELAVEVLPHLQMDAIAAADPTWLVGYDAVRSALGDLDVPVVMDVDCGHVAPHMILVNGALAEVVVDGRTQRVTQQLA